MKRLAAIASLLATLAAAGIAGVELELRYRDPDGRIAPGFALRWMANEYGPDDPIPWAGGEP